MQETVPTQPLKHVSLTPFVIITPNSLSNVSHFYLQDIGVRKGGGREFPSQQVLLCRNLFWQPDHLLAKFCFSLTDLLPTMCLHPLQYSFHTVMGFLSLKHPIWHTHLSSTTYIIESCGLQRLSHKRCYVKLQFYR